MLNAEQSQEIVGSMGKDGTEEHHPGVHTEVLCLPVPTPYPCAKGDPKATQGPENGAYNRRKPQTNPKIWELVPFVSLGSFPRILHKHFTSTPNA